MSIRQIAVKATAWAVKIAAVVVVGLLFVNLPAVLQISTSIIVAGILIASAIALKPASVVNVYGEGWKAAKREGGEP